MAFFFGRLLFRCCCSPVKLLIGDGGSCSGLRCAPFALWLTSGAIKSLETFRSLHPPFRRSSTFNTSLFFSDRRWSAPVRVHRLQRPRFSERADRFFSVALSFTPSFAGKMRNSCGARSLGLRWDFTP